VGSINDRRAAAARILAELDERALDTAEAVLTALRCQDRVRQYVGTGAMPSPELAAIAFAEMPADDELETFHRAQTATSPSGIQPSG